MGNGGTIALLGSAFVALFLLVSAAPSNNLPSTASSYYTDTPCDCLKLRNISLNSGEDFDSSEEEEILEELQSGLDVLQRLGNTLLNAPPSPPEVGHTHTHTHTLCCALISTHTHTIIHTKLLSSPWSYVYI